MRRPSPVKKVIYIRIDISILRAYMLRRIVFTIALLAVAAPAVSEASFPRPQGFVSDFASVLSPGAKGRIESMLSAFERQSGVEVAVVTLPSLEGEPIENTAVNLYQEWGIGKKGRDAGALFLIAPNDKSMRIEVGYGLEGAINDALAGRILDEAVAPRFRAGDMDAGIAAGAMAIVEIVSQKENLGFDAQGAFGAGAAALASPVTRERGGPLSVVLKIAALIIMIILFIRHPWLFFIFLSGMGRGGRGGGFGGGFGGFGGGLSGGGGASRRW